MKSIIFCDFDGTITVEETAVAMFKEFAPAVSARVIPELYNLRMTLREGVREMLESIPARRYEEIIEFSRTKKMRSGLVELLDFLDAKGVPFVVVSGGLRVMVETVLGDLKDRVAGIYAVDIETGGEFLRVRSDFEGETELLAKVEVMNWYEVDEKVAIGDSVTDLNMAMEASLVFARDRLCKYLEERHKSYIPWNDFWEVRQHLRELWNFS